MWNVFVDTAGLYVREAGGGIAGEFGLLALDVCNHSGGVGGQTAPRVHALRPHRDLVESELLEVVYDEGGFVDGDLVYGWEGGVELLGLLAVNRHRVDRAQQAANTKGLRKQ